MTGSRKRFSAHSSLIARRAADWLEAVNEAVCRQFPQGIRETKHLALNLMQDNDSQPTSLSFMRECRAIGVKQAFTAYANPKGNADTSASNKNYQGRTISARANGHRLKN